MDGVLVLLDKAALSAHANRFCDARLGTIILDFTKGLTADEFAVIAVLINPALNATRAKLGISEAQVFGAGPLLDPTLALGLDHPTTSQPGIVNAFNFGVSWNMLGLVTRRTATRTAQAKQMQVRDDVAWREWILAGQTRQLALRIGYLNQQESIAGEGASRAMELIEKTGLDFAHHDITIDVLSVREAAYLSTADRSLALQRELAKTRFALNQNLGIPPAESISVATPDPLPLIRLDASALFEVARNRRLDLFALRAGYHSQEYQVQHDLLARHPHLTLGLNDARDTGRVRTVGFSAGISLPISMAAGRRTTNMASSCK